VSWLVNLFPPLSLVGFLILLHLVIRVIQALIIIGPRPESPLSPAAIEARRRALGKVLSSLLLWLGMFLLTSLAWTYVFVQGDDDRVFSGRMAAVVLLAASGLIVVALVVRHRLHRRRSLG
jgi:di/tricarboxylate transporter